MIDKQFFLSFIDKYNLNGLAEKAKWEIKDKNVRVHLVSNTKDMVGIIESPLSMEDNIISIYDTSNLLKLLKVTNNEIKLSVLSEHNVPIKLIIEDGEYNLEYSLASQLLISNPPSISEPNYDFVVELKSDDINKFLKSKKSLESNNVSISYSKKENGIEFLLGEKEKHSNKIKFLIKSEKNLSLNDTDKLYFDSGNINEIFSVNKDMISCMFSFSSEGLIKFEFENENKQKSKYYCVAKS